MSAAGLPAFASRTAGAPWTTVYSGALSRHTAAVTHFENAGDAEVGQGRLAVGREQNLRRLDIAVPDPGLQVHS